MREAGAEVRGGETEGEGAIDDHDDDPTRLRRRISS